MRKVLTSVFHFSFQCIAHSYQRYNKENKLRKWICHMKNFLVLLGISVLCCLTGCGSSASPVINTEGSTSMERVLGALIEGYEKTDNTVKINYSGTGSGAGIEAVLSGVCDIGLSSRPLKESEIQKGASAKVVALDGIAVIVHPSNPVSNLTLRELAAVFTGNTVNWTELGGRDAPIAVYGREAGSGSRTAFEDLIGTDSLCRYTNEYSSTGDIVGNVMSNPNSIGYISLSGIRREVKVLQINGIPCTEETIRSGEYPIWRPFLLVTGTNSTLSPEVERFLDFAMSDAASELISIAGAVAPNKER